ncbi:MAG: aspartate aminotransferase family protein [Chloroflexi bacterium HGW-Chloroflexi-1]|nr:MAG: aspartate aminotransferase family protein [Chloroflexi bacterium HGW-Chloroflexi-1]
MTAPNLQFLIPNTQYPIPNTEYPIPNTSSAIIAAESAHTSGVYPKRPLAIVRGQGAYVWDADGREYIDCVGGQGAANLGHAHPAIIQTISAQAARLISCPEIFYNDQRARLLAKLIEVAPAGLERAFLCNSGAEAVEAAIKFARLSTGRPGVVAAMRGFHGRTMGALSATWSPQYRGPFEPLVPGFSHVPFNDLTALEGAVTGDTAAVLLEVVQGEGGVHPAQAEFLHGAQALCRERGALLILDEIQTGYGRTGKFFASQHFGIEPDLMTVAKSMAGGLPMGACLIGPRVGALPPMVHGSTFGGNPLACAAAIATLDAMRGHVPGTFRSAWHVTEALPDRAARLGSHLMARLAAIQSPLIREVRGLGLLVGVDLRVKVTPILQKLQTLGILALPAGSTVLRLLPPLVIEEGDLERVVDAVETVLAPGK